MFNENVQLYEDSRACVLTKEYLEAGERELEEDFVIPVTIICLIGGLGKISWLENSAHTKFNMVSWE